MRSAREGGAVRERRSRRWRVALLVLRFGLFSHRFQRGEGFAWLASRLLTESDDGARFFPIRVTRDHHPAARCIPHTNVNRTALAQSVALAIAGVRYRLSSFVRPGAVPSGSGHCCSP